MPHPARTLRAALVLGAGALMILAGCSSPDTGTADPEQTEPPVPSDPPPSTDEPTTPEVEPAAEPEQEPLWVGVTGRWDEQGSIHLSTDGVSWEMIHETATGLNEIATDGTGFVASSSVAGSTLWHSPDGREWTEVLSTEDDLYAIAHGNGVWVAYGGTEAMHSYVSEDGVTWDGPHELYPELAGESDVRAQALAFADGRFVAKTVSCGHRHCFPHLRLHSADGITWSDPEDSFFDDGYGPFPPDGHSIIMGFRERLVVMGTDWESVPMAAQYDGETWHPIEDAPGDVALHRLHGADGAWVGLGNRHGESAGLYLSTDLTDWILISTINLSGIAVIGEIDPGSIPVVPESELAAESELAGESPEVGPGGDETAAEEPVEADTPETGQCPTTAQLEAAFAPSGADPATALGDGFADIACIGDWVRATTTPDPNVLDPALVFFHISGDDVNYVTHGTSMSCDDIGIPSGDPARELCFDW